MAEENVDVKEQAATEADVKEAPKEEKADEGPSWKEMLAAFKEAETDEEQPPTKKEPEKAPSKGPDVKLPPQLQNMMDFYNSQMATKNQDSLVEDLVRFDGELGDFPQDMVKALAIGQMVLNADLEEAFNTRTAKGSQWQAIGKGLAGELKTSLKSLNAKVEKEEESEEVTSRAGKKAAGRTSSETPRKSSEMSAEDEKMLNMTNRERLREWKKAGINLGI